MANGPATFTFDVAAPVQAAGPQAPQQALMGVSGNAGPSGVPLLPGIDMAADNSAKTMALFMKIGSDYLAPHIAAARQQKAAEGMVAAMQGMSAATIQDDEIFGNFFGDSVTVAAARQVEKMDAVNNFNIGLAEQMNELRQMDPQEFRSWYPGHMKQFMTGDPQSDALITQAFMERMPQTVDMHTKAHTAYRQEVAEKVYSKDLNTWGAALDNDHKAWRDGKLSNDSYIATQQSFVSRLAGPGGIHASEYPKWVNRAYKRFAADGNLQALKLMEDSGVLQATQTDEQYAALQKARDSAESTAIARDPALLADTTDRGMMEFHIDNGSTQFSSPEEVTAWAADYNRNVMDKYGGSKPPFSVSDIHGLVERWAKGKQHAADRLARMSGTDQTGAVQARIEALLNGTEASILAMPGQNEFVGKMAQDFILSNYGKDIPRLTKVLDRAKNNFPVITEKLAPVLDFARRGEWGPEVAQSMAFVSELANNGGETVIGRYLGEDAGTVLQFLRLGGATATPEKMGELARQVLPHKWAKPDEVKIKEVESALSNMSDKGVLNTVRGIFAAGEYSEFHMTDGGLQLWAKQTAPLVARIMQGTARSLESATKIAAGMQMGNMDVVGGIPVQGAYVGSGGFRTLEAAVNAKVQPDERGNKAHIPQTSKNYQRSVNALIQEKLLQVRQSRGLLDWPRTIEPVQASWHGGVMSMQIYDGSQEYPITFNADEVYQRLLHIQDAPPVPVPPVGYQAPSDNPMIRSWQQSQQRMGFK